MEYARTLVGYRVSNRFSYLYAPTAVTSSSPSFDFAQHLISMSVSTYTAVTSHKTTPRCVICCIFLFGYSYLRQRRRPWTRQMMNIGKHPSSAGIFQQQLLTVVERTITFLQTIGQQGGQSRAPPGTTTKTPLPTPKTVQIYIGQSFIFSGKALGHVYSQRLMGLLAHFRRRSAIGLAWRAVALRGLTTSAALQEPAPKPVPLSKLKDSFLDGTSSTYLEELEERYRANPASVDKTWASFFNSMGT